MVQLFRLRRAGLILAALIAAVSGLSPSASAAATQPLPPVEPATHPTLWACRPDVTPNPCHGSLETTHLSSMVWQQRRVSKVETPPHAVDPQTDCFFVYPTVSSVMQPSAPLSVTGEIRSILQYQAARFSQTCRVYAPVYRQLTHLGIVLPIETQQQLARLAYSDVLKAWRDYLANDNGGRGVVFIGHSQGTGMLIRLLKEEIEPSAELRSRMVSAILPGSNLSVERGQRTGGDFTSIPTCASGDENGCAVAWSTFGHRPALGSQFGRVGTIRRVFGTPAGKTSEAVCVSPGELAGDGDRLETITRSEPFPGLIGAALSVMFLGLPPKAATPWVVPAERYRGSCVRTSSGANVLLLRTARAGTIMPLPSPGPGFGLHLADLNLPLGNVVRLVARQIAAYERGSR